MKGKGREFRYVRGATSFETGDCKARVIVDTPGHSCQGCLSLEVASSRLELPDMFGYFAMERNKRGSELIMRRQFDLLPFVNQRDKKRKFA
jgi:hypothetical protein